MKGLGNYTLEKFVGQHNSAYISMHQCAEHMDFQLPNEHTRVKFVVDGILCGDTDLKAAIAMVKQDRAPTGMYHNFEPMAAYIIPNDPVAKRLADASGKRPSVRILDANVQQGPPRKKKRVGDAGVELRFHSTPEYKKLTVEQKDDL